MFFSCRTGSRLSRPKKDQNNDWRVQWKRCMWLVSYISSNMIAYCDGKDWIHYIIHWQSSKSAKALKSYLRTVSKNLQFDNQLKNANGSCVVIAVSVQTSENFMHKLLYRFRNITYWLLSLYFYGVFSFVEQFTGCQAPKRTKIMT